MKVLFGFGSKTGTAAALAEEAYAVCAENDAGKALTLYANSVTSYLIFNNVF